jgi:hypothetical protein
VEGGAEGDEGRELVGEGYVVMEMLIEQLASESPCDGNDGTHYEEVVHAPLAKIVKYAFHRKQDVNLFSSSN